MSLFFLLILWLNCVVAMICHVESVRSRLAESINDVAQSGLTEFDQEFKCCFVGKERNHGLRYCFLQTSVE